MSSTAGAFYFDLASPLAYLAAERVLRVLGGRARINVEWRPVLARELMTGPAHAQYHGARATKKEPQSPPSSPPTVRDARALREHVERRARELELQPVRWPDPFPFDSELAMRVATYAAAIGRAVPFAQAAFRQAFAGGHSLEDPSFVLIAAAACEMHPQAVLRGAELHSTAERLADTTAEAAAAGVDDVPAILLLRSGTLHGGGPSLREDGQAGGGQVFVGEDAPERAGAWAGANTAAATL